MISLALDTATPSTVVALCDEDGTILEARDDTPPGSRPRHAAAVLSLGEELLARSGRDWADLDRIGVGVGPGGFTGLRIGVSTARALAQAHGIDLAPVSSLEALALGAVEEASGRPVLAAIDARRGEVFAAAWSDARELSLEPAAYGIDALIESLAPGGTPLAVGDGALRFAGALVAAGVDVPDASSPLHRISGEALCRLAVAAEPLTRDAVLPDYQRQPDAQPPRRP